MKRRRENKIFKKLINVKYLPILAVLLILGLSIGFSAFQETLLVDDMVANVRLIQDAKITSAQLDSVTNHAESNYIEVTDNTLSGSIKLPEASSTVTYMVEFKNLNNVEVGILDITSDNNDIEVISTGTYTLEDKVCDDTTPSKCTLGATKVLYITVGYSENGYDALTTGESKEFTLTFDVRSFASVTYVNIPGSGYPTEVINGGTLEIYFGMEIPNNAYITMDGVLLTYSEFSYIDGTLYIPDVSGNIVIGIGEPPSQGGSEESCEVTNVKSFGNTCTLSEDNDSSETVTKGDKVTCGTESFYVIENPSNGTVKMLTEWNLNVSEPGNFIANGTDLVVPYSYTYCESTVGYQDLHVRGYVNATTDSSLLPYTTPVTIEEYGVTPWPYGIVKFDSTPNREQGYWTTGDNHDLNTSVYTACSGESYCNSFGYPAYVYDSNATLKTFVDTYVGYLNAAISGANAQGRLITYEELIDLGCVWQQGTLSQPGDISSCSASPATAPAWVYQTSYWSGSAYNGSRVWGVESDGNLTEYATFDYDISLGVRPVITISSSAIQTS